MKRHIFFVITAMCLILFQYAFLAGIKSGYIALDIIIPFLVWWAMRTPLPAALLDTVAAAVLAELLSAMPPGLLIFSWATACLSTRYITGYITEPGTWQQMFIVAFVSMETTVILQTGSGAIELVWPWGILQVFLNAATAPLFFKIFNMAHHPSSGNAHA
jgi:hypothetical protein